jgi:glycosyltransferase involved in cell wall biosynthesis
MKILILCTWFPYPQNQGSKIRAYHLIRALARDHELALISYEDQPIDNEWLEHLRNYFQLIKVLPEKPFTYSKIKKLAGFFSPYPAAAFAGYNKNMEKLVLQTAKEWRPDHVFAFTFVTAPYALKIPQVKRIVDIDNLLAIMLREDVNFGKNWFQKSRRYLAFKKMKNYENKIYRPFDKCLVVSDLDVKRVQEYTEIQPSQLICAPNGVDLDVNQPVKAPKVNGQLIYNGALTYYPNYDAMSYFLTEIFPIILQARPELTVVITGKTDGVPIDQLPFQEYIQFTGYVEDIRPFVSSSQVCIVPLRQGAGTRLKILEAMALGTAVVSTRKGAEGLSFSHPEHILLADTPQEFANAVVLLLNNEELRLNLEQSALKAVQTMYDWKIIEQKFAGDVRQMSIQGDPA